MRGLEGREGRVGREGIAAWAAAAVVAIAVCYSVLQIPLQVSDSLIPMLDAQKLHSVVAAFRNGAGEGGYLRPLRAAQIQLLFNESNGRYFLVFRSYQIAWVLLVFVVFMLVLDVNSPTRLAASLVALTVLAGLHTFRGTVWEAYPVNHSLEIVALCLLALALSLSRGGRWVDVAAAAAFGWAVLTVESGVLVWVVVAAASLIGARGVSRRALGYVTGLLALYLLWRFSILHTGLPALSERSSGFGLRQLGPGELQQRFGAHPIVFYAYNVISSLMTVLFSEPRAGIWTIPAQLAHGRVAAGTLINVVSSTLTTLLIGWYVATRASAWRQWRFERDDHVMIVALAVIVANAVISYGYTKDEIMGPAGVFYALAAYVALAECLRGTGAAENGRRADAAERTLSRGGSAIVVAAMLVMSCGWVIRTAGLHYQMHLMTFYDRNEWVYVDDWLRRQKSEPASDEGRALVRQLRDDAIDRDAINPYMLSPRLDQWFQ